MKTKHEPLIHLASILIFVNEKGQILLGKRKGSFAEGEYSLPGGHMEKGETYQQSLIREVKEETGVILKEQDLTLTSITNFVVAGWDRQYVTFDFVVKQWDGTIANPEPDKCEGWEWYDEENLPHPLHYTAKRVLLNYMEWKKTGTVILD